MKRILLVDDEPSVLYGICDCLRSRRRDWEPALALDTEEACARLDAEPGIDVLICDLSMPGGGGVEVLRHARESHPNLPRIVLSGHGRGYTAEKASPLCDRLLEKPCPPCLLHQTIEWALHQSTEAASAHRQCEKAPNKVNADGQPPSLAEFTRA